MVDVRTGAPFTTITDDDVIVDDPVLVGGETLTQLAQTLSSQVGQTAESLDRLKQTLTQQFSSQIA